MSIGAHQSAKAGTDTWLTPPGILESLGEFDLDPCTPPEMPWSTAARRYTEEDDGLEQPWDGRVWLNPPYGKVLGLWLRKMSLHDRGTALIFARTETEAFFRYVWEAAGALLFLEGRIHFHWPDGARAKSNAGAPSVLVAYGVDDVDVLAECDLEGAFVPLGCVGQTVLVTRHGVDVTWRELMEAVVDRQGGRVTLEAVYALVSGHPKARRNPNWRAKVRQVLQRDEFRRVGRGEYEIVQR